MKPQGSRSQRPQSPPISGTHRADRSSKHSRPPQKPLAGYRQRAPLARPGREEFNAPEPWHEPVAEPGTRVRVRTIIQPAGAGYVHPVTPEEVAARLAELPARLTDNLEVIQFSRMTRKRRLFPCYGMQWGPAIYLFPIEETLVEPYLRAPTPAQQIEARMFGGVWQKAGNLWTLTWTTAALKDFYLNNVLIHEVGHLNDPRNSTYRDREKYANWFAIEYGYRASRGRR